MRNHNKKKGNTVGSRRILTLEQKRVLIGTLLGDATLELNGRFTRLRVDHSVKQDKYVKWQYKIFHNLTTGGIKYFSQFDERRNKRDFRCKFDTMSLPILNEFRSLFYPNGKKRIPKNICEILKDPLSLAVWFMDDGYKRNDCNALRISTDSFTIKEQQLLLSCIEKNFGIIGKLHRKGANWNIYIPSTNLQANKFCNLVKPYIISSMRYKILLTP